MQSPSSQDVDRAKQSTPRVDELSRRAEPFLLVTRVASGCTTGRNAIGLELSKGNYGDDCHGRPASSSKTATSDMTVDR